MATTRQAPVRNAPWTVLGMTMAVHGAMENASGGTMNASWQTLVTTVQGQLVRTVGLSC